MTTWVDTKGRAIDISTMSNKWLNNIRKMYRSEREKIKPIMDEIKRRKKIRKNFNHSSDMKTANYGLKFTS